MHLVTLIPSFINFKYNYILEFLSYWGPTFAHTWDAQNEMLWYGYMVKAKGFIWSLDNIENLL